MKQYVLALLIVLVTVHATPLPTATIQTQEGPVAGYYEDGVAVYHGIPYAAPPTGNNRFRSPQTVTPWTETIQRIEPNVACPQVSENQTGGEYFYGKEDCLYLSVYTPTKPQAALRPIFFWIYGGGYGIGDAYEFGKYDAHNITRDHNYIVVTHNYRLGALGFMALDQLKQETSTGSTGNYGLFDQRAALQWVQRNIKAFGGDPNNVTIAGESAGGISICWHMVSPLSYKLFHGAIMESSSCDSTSFFPTYKNARSWSELVASTHGCNPSWSNVTSCLRALSVEDLIFVSKELYHYGDTYYIDSLYPVFDWGAAIDGSSDGLMDLPLNILNSGSAYYVPTIIGTNNNEGSLFVAGMPLFLLGDGGPLAVPMTENDVVRAIKHFMCDNQTVINNILAMYPLDDYKNPGHQCGIIFRDWFFLCPTRRAIRAMSKFNPGKQSLYHFEYNIGTVWWDVGGDFHSSELNYVFNHNWPDGLEKWNATDQVMADTFGAYWSNLVFKKTPNGPEQPPTPLTWPTWDSTNEQHMVLTVPQYTGAHLQSTQCQMWDQLQIMGCSH